MRLALLLLAALLPGAAVAQPTPPGAPREAAPPPGPIRGGMRQPEPRASVQERERAAGVATPSEQEQRELRELNDLSRQLAPPGTPVPAPQVAPKR
jgi:hypothetical protein